MRSWVTPARAAALLGCTSRYVRRLAATGRIPGASRLGGIGTRGRWRIPRAWVEARRNRTKRFATLGEKRNRRNPAGARRPTLGEMANRPLVSIGVRVPLELAEEIERMRVVRACTRTDVVLDALRAGVAARKAETPTMVELMRRTLRERGRADVDALSDDYVRGLFDAAAAESVVRDADAFTAHDEPGVPAVLN